MNQRDLIAAAVRDMAIERVVAGVDNGTGEPAAIGARGGIEHLFGRLDPVDLARRLGPEALGIGQRAGVDLVVAAFSVDVHGALPAGSPSSSCPALCRASTYLHRFYKGTTWMARTSPAMTAARYCFRHCHGKLRA